MRDGRIMEGVVYVADTYPVCSAGFWWQNNGMNALIDAGADIYAVTRRVNGGLNGIEDRCYYYDRACKAIL
jgi:predicted chitinase